MKRDIKTQSLQALDSRKFYTECVSYSRACVIPFMANEWRAAKTWPYQYYGSASLARSLENCTVDVYVDTETTNNKESFSGYSFKEDTVEQMNYKQFLSQMSRQPTGMTARASSDCVRTALEKDLEYPKFYHEFGEFERLELTQAQIIIDNAHYDRFDQFICAMDGVIDMRSIDS